MFNPREIIFSVTDSCNLHCGHCFISRSSHKLNCEEAINFLKSYKAYEDSPKNTRAVKIDKIGFSGGEPFLALDLICNITKAALQMDFFFDQIITNGDWWLNEEDLVKKLQKLYDAGYDGKIGLSWDSFHAQNKERMEIFIGAVQELFGEDSISIQSVIPFENPKLIIPNVEKSELGDIPLYTIKQCFPGKDPRSWQARKWFKDDYCEGPGQILYVHPTGNIAPCCGFANENPQLFVGRLSDSFESVMDKAYQNKMVKLCYEEGLRKYQKKLKKAGHHFPGKCDEICAFCDYICSLQK